MRSVVLVTAVAIAAVGITVPQAAADSCQQDGVASLCVSSAPAQGGTNLNYRITQLDGPGAYSIYYVDSGTGAMSAPQPLAPIRYQATATGTLAVASGSCYTVNLASTAGTYVVVDSVCG